MKKMLLAFACLLSIGAHAQQLFDVKAGNSNFNKPGSTGVAFTLNMSNHWECLGNGYSKIFVSRNCGFTIPSNATIDGIRVACDVIIGTLIDSSVYLTRNGNTVGTDGAHHLPIISASSITWGADTAKWGTTWTPAQINDTSFGVEFRVKEIDNTNPFSWGDANPIFFQVTYTLPSSVEKFTATRMSVYPNPATNEVVLQPGKELYNATLTITNALGQVIQEQPFTGKEQTINISKIPSGTYHFTIRSGNGSFHAVVQKQ
jgi:hypothetical protein